MSTTPPGCLCPKCRFQNKADARVCLMCKTQLWNRQSARQQVRSETARLQPGQLKQLIHRSRARFYTDEPQAASAPTRPSPSRSGGSPSPGGPIGWLHCSPLAPVALIPGSALTVGRSAQCDVVLPHTQVSRIHAVITVLRDGALFADKGSSNGSYHNGQRVDSAVTLATGDVLAIGPYELVVRSGASPDDDPADEEHRTELGHVMHGDLQDVPLTELLSGLEFHEKTGTLRLICGRRRGVVVVEQGRPTFAAFGPTRDAEAVLEMLATPSTGLYTFVHDVAAAEERMHGVTFTGLLLEASRRSDEAPALR